MGRLAFAFAFSGLALQVSCHLQKTFCLNAFNSEAKKGVGTIVFHKLGCKTMAESLRKKFAESFLPTWCFFQERFASWRSAHCV